jgi:polyisoprenoid-binding protein YceI
MVNKNYLSSHYVFPVLIVFSLLAACSAGSKSEQSAPPTEQRGSGQASNTPTYQLTSSPSTTQVPSTQTPVPPSPTGQVIVKRPGLNDLPDLETLKAIFNQDAGRPRIILLLSTGCPSCLVGAHWIDQVLLQQNPELAIKVYAIWFPTVAENLLPGAINPKWDPGTLTDPRVIHFWDPQRVASIWLAGHQDYKGPQRSALARTVDGLIWGKAIWDTYFLYGPQAKWDESLSGLMISGFPIAYHWGDIRRTLGIKRQLVEITANPATYQIDPQETLVTYQVSEVFAGKDLNNAIGVTQAITGTFKLDTQNPRQSMVGQIQVDISTLRSDNWLRDDRLRNEFLESARFPLAVFTPRELKGLPDSYTPGEALSFDMLGDLEVHKTVAPVTFQVKASLVDGWLVGTAITMLKMTDFGFDPPALGGGLIKAGNQVDLKIDFAAKPAS